MKNTMLRNFFEKFLFSTDRPEKLSTKICLVE